MQNRAAHFRKLAKTYNFLAVVYNELICPTVLKPSEVHGDTIDENVCDPVYRVLDTNLITSVLKGDSDLPWENWTKTEDLRASRQLVSAFHKRERLKEEQVCTVDACMM